jgi:hypothetical protein
MSRRHQIAADIPIELAEADELLRKYGRSVMDRYKKMHCASAEGRYSIPPNDDDREPREVLLPASDVSLVQRALASMPEIFRTVLQILYVPKRLPAEAQLRRLQIPPKLSAERHLEGLRLFVGRHRVEVIKVERAVGGLRRIRNHAEVRERLVLWLDKVPE